MFTEYTLFELILFDSHTLLEGNKYYIWMVVNELNEIYLPFFDTVLNFPTLRNQGQKLDITLKFVYFLNMLNYKKFECN